MSNNNPGFRIVDITVYFRNGKEDSVVRRLIVVEEEYPNSDAEIDELQRKLRSLVYSGNIIFFHNCTNIDAVAAFCFNKQAQFITDSEPVKKLLDIISKGTDGTPYYVEIETSSRKIICVLLESEAVRQGLRIPKERIGDHYLDGKLELVVFSGSLEKIMEDSNMSRLIENNHIQITDQALHSAWQQVIDLI